MRQERSSKDLEGRIRYTFEAPALLEEALTHPSCIPRSEPESTLKTYERLAYVGDRVVNLLVVEELCRRVPGPPEMLEYKRGPLSSNYRLAEAARRIELGLYLRVGNCDNSEERKLRGTESVLATAMEALVGAIFLDSGRDYNLLGEIFIPRLFENVHKILTRGLSHHNKVAKLHRLAQERFGIPPRFCVTHEGPTWVVVELFFGEHMAATGSGNNEQAARRRAALAVLTKTMNLTCNLPTGLLVTKK